MKALPARSLREFKPALTAETEDLREHFEERAGILEYDASLPRPEAELEAARITATLGPSWILSRKWDAPKPPKPKTPGQTRPP